MGTPQRVCGPPRGYRWRRNACSNRQDLPYIFSDPSESDGQSTIDSIQAWHQHHNNDNNGNSNKDFQPMRKLLRNFNFHLFEGGMCSPIQYSMLQLPTIALQLL